MTFFLRPPKPVLVLTVLGDLADGPAKQLKRELDAHPIHEDYHVLLLNEGVRAEIKAIKREND